MTDFSIIIGGKAGDGINQSGLLISHLLNYLGWYIYLYIDYPSLIRGGHNFAYIRASKIKISAHSDKINFLLALNQETIDTHLNKLKNSNNIIYDSETTVSNGFGIPLKKITNEENSIPIMRSSILIGALAKNIGITMNTVETVFKKHIPKQIELNLKLAIRGFNEAAELIKIDTLPQKALPILMGNEAIGLGLANAGLTSYISYPMTPTSNILHFLAENAENLNLKVIHPESEICVILMALGLSYTGEKVAVGTSGGGFCLMTEGLSFSGMSEQPVVIVVGQRPGPSTGLPTYTAQGDLNFVLNAGHGEFSKFVVAPGTVEQAYFWSGMALCFSWKYQIPSIILSDKTLCENGYSFEIDQTAKVEEAKPMLWNRKNEFKRYSLKETGISPMAFPSDKDAVIKVISYEHDESGITTEDPDKVIKMFNKRLFKEKYLSEELKNFETVNISGNPDSEIVLVCFGSNVGVCTEVAENLGIRIVQPIVLHPFPVEKFKEALNGSKKIISVENNATAQLSCLLKISGFNTDKNILKYDGRPFSIEELENKIKEVIS